MTRVFLRLIVAATLALLSACSTAPLLPSGQLRANDWVSFDGKIMPYRVWRPFTDEKPRAIVIAIHGLSGASSDFWPLGEHLRQNGCITYAYELRGQGNDPATGDRGDIASAEVWQRDLAVFHKLIRRKHPRTPVFWYGESLGSLVATHTAAHRLRWSDPDGLILATPIAGLRMNLSGMQRWLLETAAALSPRTRYSLGQLAGVDESAIQVTSTTTHGGQMAQTPHHVNAFSLRLLVSIGQMIDQNPAAAAKLRMPVLLLASPNDIISSGDQIQRLFSQIRSEDKKLLWYTRSHHLILHDVQRAEALRDVERWLRVR